MKKNILLTLFLFVTVESNSQNLVPNGDFEQYTLCPTAQGQSGLATGWIVVNPSIYATDYLNACSTNSGSDVPVNNLGYQQAHSGNAYCGIFLRQGFGANVKEYVEGMFTSPLVADSCYHFEMYVNLGDNSKFSSDNIGVYFSDTIVTNISSFSPLPFTPQINNQAGVYPDSMNWTVVSGDYSAAGGESYFIAGNFQNDASMNQIIVNNTNGSDWIYIYIDDVSLVQIPPCNTGFDEATVSDEGFEVFPNPCNEYVIISSKFAENKKAELIITDVLGKEIIRKEIKASDIKFQISNYKAGIYFVEINDGKNVYRKKFLKE